MFLQPCLEDGGLFDGCSIRWIASDSSLSPMLVLTMLNIQGSMVPNVQDCLSSWVGVTFTV